MTDWMWIVLILAALFGGTVYCGFRAIAAALEERAMSDRTKAMDNLIAQDADLIDKLRDEDSYYRIQEKHWCIDAEELERQRLAAADEIERLREALRMIAYHIRDENDPYEEDYWGCRSIARAALGESHDQ